MSHQERPSIITIIIYLFAMSKLAFPISKRRLAMVTHTHTHTHTHTQERSGQGGGRREKFGDVPWLSGSRGGWVGGRMDGGVWTFLTKGGSMKI